MVCKTSGLKYCTNVQLFTEELVSWGVGGQMNYDLPVIPKANVVIVLGKHNNGLVFLKYNDVKIK